MRGAAYSVRIRSAFRVFTPGIAWQYVGHSSPRYIILKLLIVLLICSSRLTSLIDLTGPQAPKPLTAAENSTSNCYPTLPKTNSLTPVAAFNASISNLISPLIDDIFRITPVLTVFIPTNGSGNATLQQIEAQLTCLKPIDETNAALANKNSTDNGKPSGAVQVTSKLGVLGAVVMVSSLILV